MMEPLVIFYKAFGVLAIGLIVMTGICQCRLRIVSFSAHYAQDVATAAVVSTIEAGIHILEKRYPVLYKNFEYKWLDLNQSAVCENQSNSTDETMPWLARLYGNRTLDEHSSDPTIILSTACPQSFTNYVGHFARELDILAVPFIDADSRFYGNREVYPTLLSFSMADIQVYGQALGMFLGRMRWRYIAVIRDKLTNLAGIGYGQRNFQQCTSVFKTVEHSGDVDPSHALQHKEIQADSTTGEGWAIQPLLEASNFSRVIIVCTLGPQQKELAATAYDLGMANGNFIFLHQYLIEVPTEVPLQYNASEANSTKVKAAFANYFQLRPYAINWTKLEGVMADAVDIVRHNFSDTPDMDQYFGIGAEMMICAFEGLDAISQTLNETYGVPNPPKKFSGAEIAHKMINRTFELAGRSTKLNDKGMRVINMELQQFSLTAEKFQTVMKLRSDDLHAGWVEVPSNPVVWHNPTRSAPPDRPACGLRDDECDVSKYIAIGVAAAALLLLLLGSAVVFIIIKRRSHDIGNWIIGPEVLGSSDTKSITVRDGTVESSVMQRIKRKIVHINGVTAISCSPRLPVGVTVGRVNYARIIESKGFQRIIRHVTHIHHPNINKFLGIVLASVPPVILQEYCERGSLLDLLERGNVDWGLKTSLLSDLSEGLHIIHTSPLKHHGSLKPTKCVLDKRFCLKIDDLAHERMMGLAYGINLKPFTSQWSAPEVLRGGQPSPQADIYAFALIAYQVVTDCEPFSMATNLDGEILDDPKELVKNGQTRPIFYADQEQNGFMKLKELIISSWAEDQRARPSAGVLKTTLRKVTGGGGNLLDNLLKRLEAHAENLEHLVALRTQELIVEQARCDELLNEMLPRSIVKLLRHNQEVRPETFDCVTVFVSYTDGFADFVTMATPFQVVNFLDELYRSFDKVVEKFDVYKLETIGDSYLVCSGLPIPNGTKHIQQVCQTALSLQSDFTSKNLTMMGLQCGIHCGPIVAAVVGLKRPRYCLFGDTINTSSRMASHGTPTKTHMSGEAAAMAREYNFNLHSRGNIKIKGKGERETFWLLPSE